MRYPQSATVSTVASGAIGVTGGGVALPSTDSSQPPMTWDGDMKIRLHTITISVRNPRRICVAMKMKLMMISSAPSSRVAGTTIINAATTSVDHASWFIVQKTGREG